MFKSDESIASEVKKNLKALKREKFLISVVFIALGVTMLIWPDEIMDIVARAAGALMAMGGIAGIVMYFVRKNKTIFDIGILVGAAVIGVLGCRLVTSPEFLIALLPTIIGILITASGISDIGKAFVIRREYGDGFWVALILSVLSVILGVLIILNPSALNNFLIRLIGIAAIYDGVSDIWIMSQITGAVREVEKAVAAAEAAINGVPAPVKEKKGFLESLKNLFGKKNKAQEQAPAQTPSEPLKQDAEVPFAAAPESAGETSEEEEILDGTFTAAKESGYFTYRPDSAKTDPEPAAEESAVNEEPEDEEPAAEGPAEAPHDVLDDTQEPEEPAFSFIDEEAEAVSAAAEETAAETREEADEVIEDAQEAVETAFSFVEDAGDTAEEAAETGFTFADAPAQEAGSSEDEFHFTEE